MVGSQPDRRVPAAGNGEPAGFDLGARPAGQRHRDFPHPVLAAVDALGGERAMGGRHIRTRVDDRRDLQSGAKRGLDRAPAILIVGEQRDAFCRCRRVAGDVCPHRRGHHHARRIVAGKDDGTFERASRDNRAFCHDPPQALAHLVFGRRGQVVVDPLQRAIRAAIIDTEQRRAGHDADIGHCRQFGERP